MIILVAITLLIIAFMLLFLTLSVTMLLSDLFLDLPYVATDRNKIDTIIKFAQIKKGQTVVDLGSGDGRLLFAAAQEGAYAIGYELNPLLIAITLIHTKLKGLSNQIDVRRQNLWKADLKVADAIFVYSLKRDIQKFEDFVYQNAQKGTRIVVNTNPFPNKQPIKSQNGIFLYIKYLLRSSGLS